MPHQRAGSNQHLISLIDLQCDPTSDRLDDDADYQTAYQSACTIAVNGGRGERRGSPVPSAQEARRNGDGLRVRHGGGIANTRLHQVEAGAGGSFGKDCQDDRACVVVGVAFPRGGKRWGVHQARQVVVAFGFTNISPTPENVAGNEATAMQS